MKNFLLLTLTLMYVAIYSNAQPTQSFMLHSHNDYLRDVPFWEAYGANAASIEVDIILQNGDLMVAHELESVTKERTFSALYMDQIQMAKDLNYQRGLNFYLLVDCKSESYETLALLENILNKYSNLLFSEGNPDGLKIVISGNRPKVEDYKNYPAYMFFDYQSTDLNADLPWEKIAMVSMSFNKFSEWNGKGRIVEEQNENLQSFINLVHSYNKPVRFWGSPDSKSAWKAFYEMGVDYINTDNPYEADSYLQQMVQNIYTNNFTYPLTQPSFAKDGEEIPVENIILLIGDGNGLAQISAGMAVNNNQLNLTQLKNIGLIKTQAADDFTTDSAAGATAFATGYKSNNRAIGVNPAGEALENLTEILNRYNFKTGIVTTDQISGATPAAFYAHYHERDAIDTIISFLPSSNLDIFIGGGKRDFTRYGKNRLQDLEANGLTLVRNLKEVGNNSHERIGYFAAAGALPPISKGRGSFLLESTQSAIKFLETKNNPFFLMVEAAMIDSGGHANNSQTVLEELMDFDKVVGWIITYIDQNPNTLLIITADHETAGVALPQGNISNKKIELAFHSDDHTGIMVPLFAYGAHSGIFRGVYENTEVFNKIMDLVKQYHVELEK